MIASFLLLILLPVFLSPAFAQSNRDIPAPEYGPHFLRSSGSSAALFFFLLDFSSASSPAERLASSENAENPRILAEKIRSIIASYERVDKFKSPLDDQALLERIVEKSLRAGISPWLLFGQAKFETTFGDPVNATTRDGVKFQDGTVGNAHNLFNIRPGRGWKGKVLDTGRGGLFRGYASYDDSIGDYCRLMSQSEYKGKTLQEILNKYFPASENGAARVKSYMDSLIQFARQLGFSASPNTVPIR
jgi:flagellum-specific peptidoglycan hydrolase FlgJ